MKILLVGGGTGGHVMPTLAVAARLIAKLPSAQLLYVGSTRPADRELVEAAGLPFKPITTGKLRRYLSWQNLVDGFKFLAGLRQAGQILKEFRPEVIFAKGGYVALPVVLAARRFKIPVIIHESDSRLGLANRLALPSATKIAVAFPLEEYLRQPSLNRYAAKFIHTGLPLPSGLVDIPPKPLFTRRQPTIFVTGGSQGAVALNRLVWEILPELVAKYNLIHQVGTANLTEAQKRQADLPSGLEQNYLPFGFDTKTYHQALKLSDLVVSRAGSMIFELQALARPAILIPLPGSAGDHQAHNARFLASREAAVVLDQRGLTGTKLQATLEQVMADEALRYRLADKLSTLGKINLSAAETLAELILTAGRS